MSTSAEQGTLVPITRNGGRARGAARAPVGRASHAPRVNIVIFWIVQASAGLAFFVPFHASLAGLCAASHGVRMLGITLAFHRHLAHRAFKMGRARDSYGLLGTVGDAEGAALVGRKPRPPPPLRRPRGRSAQPALGGFYHAHMGWFLD